MCGYVCFCLCFCLCFCFCAIGADDRRPEYIAGPGAGAGPVPEDPQRVGQWRRQCARRRQRRILSLSLSSSSTRSRRRPSSSCCCGTVLWRWCAVVRLIPLYSTVAVAVAVVLMLRFFPWWPLFLPDVVCKMIPAHNVKSHLFPFMTAPAQESGTNTIQSNTLK